MFLCVVCVDMVCSVGGFMGVVLLVMFDVMMFEGDIYLSLMLM